MCHGNKTRRNLGSLLGGNADKGGEGLVLTTGGSGTKAGPGKAGKARHQRVIAFSEYLAEQD